MASLNRKFFEFLESAIESAAEGDALYGAELHDTVYQKIKDDFGVRISTPEGSLAPNSSGVEDYDALVTLVIFARIEGSEKTDRLDALDVCDALTKAVAQLFFDDLSMGGRVCDVDVLRHLTDFDSNGSDFFAIANLPIVVNPTGAIDWSRYNVSNR